MNGVSIHFDRVYTTSVVSRSKSLYSKFILNAVMALDDPGALNSLSTTLHCHQVADVSYGTVNAPCFEVMILQ